MEWDGMGQRSRKIERGNVSPSLRERDNVPLFHWSSRTSVRRASEVCGGGCIWTYNSPYIKNTMTRRAMNHDELYYTNSIEPLTNAIVHLPRSVELVL